MNDTQASGLIPEGQQAADDQQNATGAENQEQQQEERRFTQAELDEKVQRRIAKTERKAQSEIAELRKEIEALKSTPKPVESKSDSKEPQRSEFSAYEDYVEAKALWKTEQKIEQRLRAEQEKRDGEQKKAKQEESSKAFRAKVETLVEKGNEKFSDFDAVVNEAVEDGLIAIDSAMYHGLIESDMGHEIAYWLAKNPAEAKRIAGLSPYRQASEIGKLEDKLSAKPKARDTIDPISSRGGNSGSLSDNMSMDAWAKARNKQIREQG